MCLSVLFGAISIKYSAEGSWVGLVFDIFSCAFYALICLVEGYLGEYFLSYAIIAINMFAIASWRKNQGKLFVKINKISKQEQAFFLIMWFIVFVVYFCFLSQMGSKFVFLNCLSALLYGASAYFCFRRSTFQFLFLLGYEFVFGVLWVISASASFENILFLFGAIAECSYEIQRIKNWTKAKALNIAAASRF